MRFLTYEIPRIIACAEDYPNHIALLRGCFENVCSLLSDLNIKMVLQEELCIGQPLKAIFLGQLRHEQETAANALLAHNRGVLSATTAFGKTVVAAWLIAQCQVNTLILVHRKQL